MNRKLATVVVVIVVIVAAVAVYLYLDRDGADPPRLKDAFEVGDYYTVTNETIVEGVAVTEETTYTITAVTATGYTVSETTDGVTSNIGTVTKEEYLTYISAEGDDLTYLSRTGTETIGTPFGDVRCDVYEGEIAGFQIKAWICPENSIVFRSEGSGSVLGIDTTSTMVLSAGTIFEGSDAPSGNPTLTVREQFRAGDVMSASVWERSVSGYQTETILDTETYTVIQDLGDGNLLVRFAMEETEPTESTMASSELLRLLVPDLDWSSMTSEGQEAIETSWGNVVCDVYSEVSDNTGGFDKAPVIRYWIEPGSGVMLKTVMSIDDATTSDGLHLDHWELGMSLETSSNVTTA